MDIFKTKQQKINEEFLSQPVQRDWELISKFYSPARKIIENIEKLPKDLQEKALFGVTTFLWRDKNYGDFKKEEFLGSDTPILEELTSKTKFYGPQNFKDDNGEVFTISKYIAPISNVMDLPIRN